MRRLLALALLAASTPARADMAEALARLVEIDAVAASPDGRWVAYRTRAPDPQANRYRLGWHLVAADGGSPVSLGDGGEVELRTTDDGYVVGTVRAPEPVWSPDSRHVLLPQLRRGARELWLAGPGASARRLVGGDRDVGPARWLSPARVAVTLAATSRAAAATALAEARRTGFRFDERRRPGWGAGPPAPTTDYAAAAVVGLDGRRAAAPVPPERRLPEPGARLVAPGTASAWGRLADPAASGPTAPLTVVALDGEDRALACPDPRCTGELTGIWRRRDGDVLFIRHEGPNRQSDALYRWRPGAPAVEPLTLPADAALERCSAGGDALVCVLETPVQPGRLVAIDESGVRLLVDPNPGFSVPARVERLEWDGPWGRQFAHLVHPANLPPGGRAPLVVVQYRSHGFLKGGVGDEYPVFALAAAGIAVLSFDRPNALDRLDAIGDRRELVRRILAREAADRRAIFEGLERGLDAAIRTGRIDGTRLGISGLSDGAVTTMHALVASRRFRAAAISSPTWDPIVYYSVEAGARDGYRGAGLGDPFVSTSAWREVSPALKAERIATPLLLQIADHELVASAQLLAALRDAGRPHDAYVFADEYHIKWQPAHRLAIYRRAVDWFSFWLLDREDGDPAKAAQLARWRAMRR